MIDNIPMFCLGVFLVLVLTSGLAYLAHRITNSSSFKYPEDEYWKEEELNFDEYLNKIEDVDNSSENN